MAGDQQLGEGRGGRGRGGRGGGKGPGGAMFGADQYYLAIFGKPSAAPPGEIKGKLGETYFAWKGPTAKGSADYFRVQGATVVIEYAPQGGTDHIHTVIRNPNDDYGEGLLKR